MILKSGMKLYYPISVSPRCIRTIRQTGPKRWIINITDRNMPTTYILHHYRSRPNLKQ